MKPLYFILIPVFILIYGLLNYYIGLRGIQTIGSRFPRTSSIIYWVVFWFIALSYIIGMIGRRFFPGFVGEILGFLGSYWMAAMLYFLLLIVFIDILRVANRWFKVIQFSAEKTQYIALFTGLSVLVLVLGVLIFGTWNAKNVHVKHYGINVSKSAGNIKQLHIAMISDIHLDETINKKRLDKMVDGINRLKPDIVIIAGDILDDRLEPFIKQNMSESFKRIKSKYGIFAALGNHDYFSGKLEEKVAAFENSGINVLRDKNVKVADSFYLIGREDKSMARTSGGSRKNVDDLLKGLDKSLPLIMIDHQPVQLEEPEKQGIDLQLSGHTHQGQFFPIDIITNKVFEIDYGYLKKNNFHIIVSSGYGTWGPPIRVGNSGEIVDILVNFK